mmetsp:Transcript_39746/g.95996  ORF Transcript_39746/g.95996 Transcript_39746/m.95996 type:complete len:600 (-) Transcript_39746:124-1923(-)|eukprot:CAMPEP_0113623144 /NCGR_PEP_ID=MMETSP0017_2-20120614/11898_1 /TAXON_ID=2856 /ORGANISM="Cylindrotheca closterium" /LENGTH=599 /DNA_ID=CAMNT_0000533069 /DNA_START=173 /DNA_END=1975 /DNA_ORIENTATION=- /assembly_acc=CAM_ASM_000147
MKLLSLALVLQLAATVATAATASDEKERNHLRRKTTEVIDEVTAVQDGRRRIVLHCKPNKVHEVCLKRLKEFEDGRLTIIHKLHESKAWAVSIGESDEDTIKALEEGDFFDIESDVIRKPMYIPESLQVEESGRNLQFWNRQDVPYGIEMVKAQQAWEKFNTKGAGVKVCVMDTGILGSHEDFNTNNLSGYSGREAVTPWDRDGNGHGTHVSGTIAAADNDDGVVGVAPDAQIYTVRIFDNRGDFYGSDVVAAAEACRDAGAQIISMSLGGASYQGDEKRIFDALYDQGIISIAAAGNDGDDDYSFPASYARVMSVAAVNSNRNHASFSQYNDRVDIAAPGVNVRSCWNNGRYSSISGTSMATPHVSGVAALMKSHKPNATPLQLFNAMINTAVNPNTSGRDDKYGHGIIDAVAAMDALDGNVVDDQPDDTPPPPQNCPGGKINFRFNLRTDDYGYETSWELKDETSGQIVESRGEGSLGNNAENDLQLCLNRNKCYALTIQDSYGDGLCCGNNPGFELVADGQVIQNSQDFSSVVTIPIGNCQGGVPTNPPVNSPPTNPPPPNPTNPPVAPPTQPPVPSPTAPPADEECCFLFWCWSC